jgi:dipeptidyl aminopeptidase/acylaminoacyl peptidase
MRRSEFASLTLLAVFSLPALAETPPAFDAAAAFGARPTVAHLRLSPDGNAVVYVAPTAGQGAAVFTLSLAADAKPRMVLSADGAPDRIERCDWVSNDRLVCILYAVAREPYQLTLQYVERLMAIDADGKNPKILAKRTNSQSRGVMLGDGRIIDWLPDQDGSVLMSRVTLPDDHVGSRLGSDKQGQSVDLIDTRTLRNTTIEEPNRRAASYMSDGRGTVRVMELWNVKGLGYNTGATSFLYRRKDSRQWEPLSSYDYMSHEGFWPCAVDTDLDVVYGFKKKDGRMALYTLALDGSLRETLVYARDDVDLDELVRIGRRERVVGVSYATDYRSTYFLDPAIGKLSQAISKALPTHPGLRVVDSSVDENKLLIFAGSDHDAGVYYLFDRQAHQLQTFLVAHSALENVKLASVRPVTYPAADGATVPAYLTLPPGVESARSLPAIVMPHGGPGARDEWGFHWLAQFYAARGFVVLQPNFRGSAGYGDAWFEKNGFRSWPLAIGDVLDGGRWLVSQGIADPAKLAVVGWSYGGYAALQSAVADQSVFKAVVAIAPVTDLVELKESHRSWTDYYLAANFIGEGPLAIDGSPARNAAKIKVPVLLFHGTDDINVNYVQSQLMDKSLTAAGVRHEFVTFEHLDHHLDDSAARAQMLQKSEAFLRQSLGL